MSNTENKYVINLASMAFKDLDKDVHIEVDVITAEDKQATDPELPPQFNEIDISGSVNGLLWLAKEIVAVALSADKGYHIHLDKETCAGHYHSEKDWWLTITLNENSKKASKKGKTNLN